LSKSRIAEEQSMGRAKEENTNAREKNRTTKE
jgi:hypothetical protein